MVSKARLDLPEPDSPVNTIRRSRGSSTLMFLRLCSRAPRTEMIDEPAPNEDLGDRADISRPTYRGTSSQMIVTRNEHLSDVHVYEQAVFSRRRGARGGGRRPRRGGGPRTRT